MAVSQDKLVHQFRWRSRPTLTCLKFSLSLLDVLGKLLPTALDHAAMRYLK
jgi:hypothetical protein